MSGKRKKQPHVVIKRKENTDVYGKVLIRDSVIAVVKKPVILNVLPGTDNYIGGYYAAKGYDHSDLPDVAELETTDVSRFNIFDVDTYSNPFPLFERILKLRADRDFVLIGTDGGSIAHRFVACDIRRQDLRGHEPTKLPVNYERWVLRKGIDMVGGSVSMAAVWKKGKQVIYFAWFIGKFANRK